MNMLAVVLVGLFVLLVLAGGREERAVSSPAPMIIYQSERRGDLGGGLMETIATLVLLAVLGVWLLGMVGENKPLDRASDATGHAPSLNQLVGEAMRPFVASDVNHL